MIACFFKVYNVVSTPFNSTWLDRFHVIKKKFTIVTNEIKYYLTMTDRGAAYMAIVTTAHRIPMKVCRAVP